MNKSGKLLKSMLILSFIVYTSLFTMSNMGYFDNITGKKVLETQKQIENFENDIKNNNTISIDHYLKKEKDYSNFFTECANKSLLIIKDIIEIKIVKLWDILVSIFTG